MGPLPSRAEPSDAPRGVLAQAPTLPFAELYQAHFDFVWRTLRRAGVPVSTLDDAVQDAFLAIAQRLDSYDPTRGHLRSWIYGIAMNVAMNARRRHRRKDAPCIGEASSVLERLPSSLPPPCEATEQSEALRLADRLLGELSEERREVLVLAELEEMSMTEIAESLGLNVNTAYSRLRAARRELDEILARHRARASREGGFHE